MYKRIAYLIRVLIGVILILAGVISGFIPIVQGWLLILAGLLIIGIKKETIRRWIKKAKKMFGGIQKKPNPIKTFK